MYHPKAGTIKLPSHPVKYDNRPHKHRTPPPYLGEHTEEILKNELEMNENLIKTLKTKGVIQ